MNKAARIAVVLLLPGWVLAAGVSLAQGTGGAAPSAAIDQAIQSSWSEAPATWRPRMMQDETQRQCSQSRNAPPAAEATAISTREAAAIQYPADGRFIGDWRKGEALAQNGYGGRFTDKDASRPNGGNCYACHQIDAKEISFGTLGPPLTGYGKTRKFAAADAKRVYEKIYNPQAAQACSSMPRFGASRFLTIEQIKDLVALLMDPESPVNK